MCEKYIVNVYVGGYCGLSENGLCVLCELCSVGFLVVGECESVLLQSVVMVYVLNIMEVLNVGGDTLLDRPCIVWQYIVLILTMMGRSDDTAR